jgi:hypothetical protein
MIVVAQIIPTADGFSICSSGIVSMVLLDQNI